MTIKGAKLLCVGKVTDVDYPLFSFIDLDEDGCGDSHFYAVLLDGVPYPDPGAFICADLKLLFYSGDSIFDLIRWDSFKGGNK
jgi:hypothetical protein